MAEGDKEIYPPAYGEMGDVPATSQYGYGYNQNPPITQAPTSMNQPSTSNRTTVVINQVQGAPEAAPQNIRDWETGLCGCCEDCGVCLYGCFCLQCLLCTIMADAGDHCCLACCNPFSALYGARVRFRSIYGIRGTMNNDYCAVYCCLTCAACQLRRQTKLYRQRQQAGTMMHSEVHLHQDNQRI